MQLLRRAAIWCDAHEILVPAGTTLRHQPAFDECVECPFHLVDSAAVDEHFVGHFAASSQLLMGRVVAVGFALFEGDEFIKRGGRAWPASGANPLVANLPRTVEVQQAKVARRAQGAHFVGVANRVDDVVPVGAEPRLDPLGEHGRAVFRAQTIAGLDEVFAGGFAALAFEFEANFIRERMVRETVGLQVLGGNGLARAIGSGESDNHLSCRLGLLMVIESVAAANRGPKRPRGRSEILAALDTVDEERFVASFLAQAPDCGVFLYQA